ncbi:hypothetical protein MPH_08002 [Macrophomina phaseolina MS6]|uniref:Uncharacterized protein n=1 Tax=Macrophomina phaseolina (strain MS6) TaxID=1126212 RepID=K2RPL8_MACPH|nr:hypothetical protein MPH_08002 [Macrophomina phaseolina MS6]
MSTLNAGYRGFRWSAVVMHRKLGATIAHALRTPRTLMADHVFMHHFSRQTCTSGPPEIPSHPTDVSDIGRDIPATLKSRTSFGRSMPGSTEISAAIVAARGSRFVHLSSPWL